MDNVSAFTFTKMQSDRNKFLAFDDTRFLIIGIPVITLFHSAHFFQSSAVPTKYCWDVGHDGRITLYHCLLGCQFRNNDLPAQTISVIGAKQKKTYLSSSLHTFINSCNWWLCYIDGVGDKSLYVINRS